MNKLYTFLVPESSNLSFEQQKKLKYLININSVLIIFYSFIIINRLFISRNIPMAIGLGVITFLLISALFCVKSKKYSFAENITNISCLICANAVVYTAPIDSYLIIFKLGFFLLTTIFASALVSFNKRVIIIYSILSEICLVLFFILKLFPHCKGSSGKEYIWGSLVVFLCIIVTSILVYFLLALSKSLIDTFEKESIKNEERYHKLEEVLISSKQSLYIGENLSKSTEKSIVYVSDINNSILSIKNQILILNKEIEVISKSNAEINYATKNVKSIVENQNISIEHSASSVSSISKSIEKVVEFSKTKRESISALAVNTKNGEEKMAESTKAMENIARSAEEMLDMIKVIIQVAQQTNLLAMNASIEAAHAGEFGKGFAVVADEIRVLADETNNSTKEITAKLKNNQNIIDNATAINGETSRTFKTINRDVVGISSIIEEIINNFEKLSLETTTIISHMNNLIKLSKGTAGSIDDVENKVNNSNNGIKNVSNLSSDILKSVESILNDFNNIINEVTNINTVGKENIKNIQTLESQIKNIK